MQICYPYSSLGDYSWTSSRDGVYPKEVGFYHKDDKCVQELLIESTYDFCPQRIDVYIGKCNTKTQSIVDLYEQYMNAVFTFSRTITITPSKEIDVNNEYILRRHDIGQSYGHTFIRLLVFGSISTTNPSRMCKLFSVSVHECDQPPPPQLQRAHHSDDDHYKHDLLASLSKRREMFKESAIQQWKDSILQYLLGNVPNPLTSHFIFKRKLIDDLTLELKSITRKANLLLEKMISALDKTNVPHIKVVYANFSLVEDVLKTLKKRHLEILQLRECGSFLEFISQVDNNLDTIEMPSFAIPKQMTSSEIIEERFLFTYFASRHVFYHNNINHNMVLFEESQLFSPRGTTQLDMIDGQLQQIISFREILKHESLVQHIVRNTFITGAFVCRNESLQMHDSVTPKYIKHSIGLSESEWQDYSTGSRFQFKLEQHMFLRSIQRIACKLPMIRSIFVSSDEEDDDAHSNDESNPDKESSSYDGATFHKSVSSSFDIDEMVENDLSLFAREDGAFFSLSGKEELENPIKQESESPKLFQPAVQHSVKVYIKKPKPPRNIRALEDIVIAIQDGEFAKDGFESNDLVSYSIICCDAFLSNDEKLWALGINLLLEIHTSNNYPEGGAILSLIDYPSLLYCIVSSFVCMIAGSHDIIRGHPDKIDSFSKYSMDIMTDAVLFLCGTDHLGIPFISAVLTDIIICILREKMKVDNKNQLKKGYQTSTSFITNDCCNQWSYNIVHVCLQLLNSLFLVFGRVQDSKLDLKPLQLLATVCSSLRISVEIDAISRSLLESLQKVEQVLQSQISTVMCLVSPTGDNTQLHNATLDPSHLFASSTQLQSHSFAQSLSYPTVEEKPVYDSSSIQKILRDRGILNRMNKELQSIQDEATNESIKSQHPSSHLKAFTDIEDLTKRLLARDDTPIGTSADHKNKSNHDDKMHNPSTLPNPPVLAHLNKKHHDATSGVGNDLGLSSIHNTPLQAQPLDANSTFGDKHPIPREVSTSENNATQESNSENSVSGNDESSTHENKPKTGADNSDKPLRSDLNTSSNSTSKDKRRDEESNKSTTSTEPLSVSTTSMSTGAQQSVAPPLDSNMNTSSNRQNASEQPGDKNENEADEEEHSEANNDDKNESKSTNKKAKKKKQTPVEEEEDPVSMDYHGAAERLKIMEAKKRAADAEKEAQAKAEAAKKKKSFCVIS